MVNTVVTVVGCRKGRLARGGGSKGGAKMAHIRVYHEVLEVCPKENAAHMCPWMQLTGMRSMRGWETRTMLSGGKKGVGFYCKNTISVWILTLRGPLRCQTDSSTSTTRGKASHLGCYTQGGRRPPW